MAGTKRLWTPSADRIERSIFTSFRNFVNARCNTSHAGFASLYDWSVQERELFWSCIWDFCGVIGIRGERVLVDGADIEKAVWFPDARLNFAENLLRQRGAATAIYFCGEDQVLHETSWDGLREQVAKLAAWLRGAGVTVGDRVAGYMPNIPETVIAMLATTSLVAVWTSTSPDFGKQSVLERFGQTEPKVLITVDGYSYNGKIIDIRPKIEAVQQGLASLARTVVVRFASLAGGLPGEDWGTIVHGGEPAPALEFTRVGFNDPLYIMYSSGTTGKPKCITHKTGGVLLQHLKELQLHSDVQPGDRVFYFTTCGWMMWNWLVSALACRAAIVLYDGSPFYPGPEVLWDYGDEVGITLFGTSAKYLDALRKSGLKPMQSHKLTDLKTICSTGSVLVPESFDWVYSSIKEDVCLASISGGTDIISCFVLGCPVLPVYSGESQCRGLGLAVEVFNGDGHAVIGEQGELVCTATFPSQPAFFWGDATGEKYHNTYFAKYPNVWHHGDYVQLNPSGGVIIFGRSDATLNPGGVRIGTAEIYRYVEQLDEVVESVAIGQDWDDDVRIVLFVVLREGCLLTVELEQRLRQTIRENCSPRHVPAKIVAVPEIPRTKSGKIVELAVREVIHDRPVKNISSLANPDALNLYKDIEALQS